MSNLRGSTRSPLSSTNGAPRAGTLVPTNNVTTLDGRVLRARIDATLTVDDVVKQLCINIKLDDPASNFALRTESDELVTNDNLRRMIKGRLNLRFVLSRSLPVPPFTHVILD